MKGQKKPSTSEINRYAVNGTLTKKRFSANTVLFICYMNMAASASAAAAIAKALSLMWLAK